MTDVKIFGEHDERTKAQMARLFQAMLDRLEGPLRMSIKVLEKLEMPRGVEVSGLESDGGDQFFCGGGRSGKVRTVRRRRA